MASIAQVTEGLTALRADVAAQKLNVEAAVVQLNAEVLRLRDQLDQGVVTTEDLGAVLGLINTVRQEVAGIIPAEG